MSGLFSARAANKLQKAYKTSGRTSVYRLRGDAIRKKVIGHGMLPVVAGFAGDKRVWRSWSALTLLEKQARQHGGSVLLHPLIDQRANFLAEIGGMSKARQFKTLQRVSRS